MENEGVGVTKRKTPAQDTDRCRLFRRWFAIRPHLEQRGLMRRANDSSCCRLIFTISRQT
jgi:hypothetical protein